MKSHWSRDNTSHRCELCLQLFTFFRRRRHHCRDCGGLFCHNCLRQVSSISYRNNTDYSIVCLLCFRFAHLVSTTRVQKSLSLLVEENEINNFSIPNMMEITLPTKGYLSLYSKINGIP